MTTRVVHVVVPGVLEQRTGGYLYDARMVAGLRALGWRVTVHNLSGVFPYPDDVAHISIEDAFAEIEDGAWVVLDGLAFAAAGASVARHQHRLVILALVHHPLCDETGLDASTSAQLAEQEARVLQAVRGVIVTSRYTARRLHRFGVERDRVRVVVPGTDSSAQATGQPPNVPLQLLVVASVVPRKGHDVLFRALNRVRDRRWHCVCVGSLERDRMYADTVVAQLAAANLSDRVDLLGECDSATLDRLYVESSVFVLPSHYEGYGMAIAEALARGLPIISTTGGAIPDTIPPDVGLFVSPGDDRALADALSAFLGDGFGTSLRSACAVAARKHAATLPSWEIVVNEMKEALIVLANAPAPSGVLAR